MDRVISDLHVPDLEHRHGLVLGLSAPLGLELGLVELDLLGVDADGILQLLEFV